MLAYPGVNPLFKALVMITVTNRGAKELFVNPPSINFGDKQSVYFPSEDRRFKSDKEPKDYPVHLKAGQQFFVTHEATIVLNAITQSDKERFRAGVSTTFGKTYQTKYINKLDLEDYINKVDKR
jgi:hypothetical protein